MEVISKILRMRAVVDEMRTQGRPVGLVPTMGALHEGHLSLVRLARERGAEIVVSIFVNPAQFEDGKDLMAYPRDLTRDAELLAKEGVKFVFAPGAPEMYPEDHCTVVEATGLSDVLVGVDRPGHFRGVTTVVAKLLNIIEPAFAVFGWKDAQQLVIVRRMVRDLDMNVEIVGSPTVREEGGLALSSRNVLLDTPGRRAAAALFRALKAGRKLVKDGEHSAEVVLAAVKEVLAEEDLIETDSVDVVSLQDLRPLKKLRGEVLLAVSARVRVEGGHEVRLIDNLRMDVQEEE